MRQALAPAKINLFLHVGAPTADGYHPLCSLMVFADLGDRLSAEAAPVMDLEVRGPFASGLSSGADNLVLRAAHALRSAAGVKAPDLHVLLDKRLPVASGLGGGSSDAGAAFRLLRDIWAAPVSDERLQAMAASLGADGAACLWGAPVLAQGRGEQITPVHGLPLLHAVLVNSREPVSTPAVYRRFDEGERFADVAPPGLPAFANAAEVTDWLSTLRNDLEGPAIAVEATISVVMTVLRSQPETRLARVSGSGGTCFALCESAEQADEMAARLAVMAPQWWVRPCQLGGPWPDPA